MTCMVDILADRESDKPRVWQRGKLRVEINLILYFLKKRFNLLPLTLDLTLAVKLINDSWHVMYHFDTINPLRGVYTRTNWKVETAKYLQPQPRYLYQLLSACWLSYHSYSNLITNNYVLQNVSFFLIAHTWL